MPKGIPSDEYGVTPDQCRWIVGGLDWPLAPIDFIPQPHPANVDMTPAPGGKDLGEMLEAAEIDALISADVPKCALNNSPKVARLFSDYEFVEREYYRRTGIFPIMHTVVIRKELAAQCPGLAKAIYQGFCDAKDVAMEHYTKGTIFNNMNIMMPWFSNLIDKDRRVLGDDWWPKRILENSKWRPAHASLTNGNVGDTPSSYGGQGALRLLMPGCFPISRAEAREAKPLRWAYSSVGRAADS